MVPSDHVTVTLRPAQSFRTKQRKKGNRPSLRFIPEGSTRRKRSIYRRMSEDATGCGDLDGSDRVFGRKGTKRVTFGATRRESVVEIPDDVANIVEHKMVIVIYYVRKV